MKGNHICGIRESQPHRTYRRRILGKHRSGIGSSIFAPLALGLTSLVGGSISLAAATSGDETARAQWRDTIIRMQTPDVGCYQAKFPSTLWEAIPCRTLSPHTHTHPTPRISSSGQGQIVGNGNDYTLAATGLITETVGSFPSVSGVTIESSVGVPSFGGGGILGRNEYTLQVNTNDNTTTSACSGGGSGCTVWQQFIYSTDYETKGSAAVFIQYWLLNYGASCPSGYTSSDGSCYRNSSYVTAPDVAITSLESLKMTGTASPGGNDSVTFTDGTSAYSVTASDSVLGIGSVWRDSEFNVVGDGGGSEAILDQGTAITVHVEVSDGSTSAPTCISNEGTTGETNNHTLGSCTAASGTTPSIQFTESWSGTTDSSTMTEGTRYILGGGQITTYKGFGTAFIGSMSPAKMSDGLTYYSFFDLKGTGVAEGVVALSGFTSDPGQGWLGSATAVGVTKTAPSATYSYSSGVATWTWATEFGFTGSGTTAVKITHQ